jgi:hypothetical protein
LDFEIFSDLNPKKSTFSPLTPGVFYLGGFSFINSMVAVLWMIFIVVLLFFPTYQTPNAEQMNNAIVVVGFVVVFCLSYYCFPKYGGKTFFDEPVRTINSKENVSLCDMCI